MIDSFEAFESLFLLWKDNDEMTAQDELDYINELIDDFEITPQQRIATLIQALEAEVAEEQQEDEATN